VLYDVSLKVHESPKILPDPPMWSAEGTLSVVLLGVSVACTLVALLNVFLRPSTSTHRAVGVCFWIPVVATAILALKRISYEFWIFAYYGYEYDPSKLAKERALFLGNIACFILVVFVLITAKFVAQSLKKTNSD